MGDIPAFLGQAEGDVIIMVSLPYKQRAFIIYDNDVTLKIFLSASSAFKVTVRDWLASGVGWGYGEG